MARQESDREDLMREATALRRRGELIVPDQPAPVVAGFRADGALSVYFGADPVYHFDSAGRLRRAFVDGDLYRTQGRTLARLVRVRTPDETELRRTDLAKDELASFRQTVRDRLARLRAAVRGGAVIVQQVPAADAAFRNDLCVMLETTLDDGVPLAPAIKGR